VVHFSRLGSWCFASAPLILVLLCCREGFTGPPSDTDRDGLTDQDEVLLYGTQPGNPDTDNDGLLDGWEVNGYTRGGFLEPLPAYGASPTRKDIFVEIDWMESEEEASQFNAKIAYEAAADVIRAFRESGTGIEIHIDLGPRIESLVPPEVIDPELSASFSDFEEAEPDEEKVLPYQDRFPARPVRGEGPESTAISLYDVYYGGRYFRPSRRNIFYYVVLAEQSQPSQIGTPGTTRPFTDDFGDELARRDGLRYAGAQVAVIYRKHVADLEPQELRYQYSVALLHELGHMMGLGHGGADQAFVWNNTNWKPNYPSSMNYRFWNCGLDMVDGAPVLGLSHGLLATALAESALREAVGIGVAEDSHLLTCLDVDHLSDPMLPRNLDWNGDGVVSVDLVSSDVNQSGSIDAEVFTDHDDWARLERDGFDGIGMNAYRRCGMSCGRGGDVVRVPGDFNGDGFADLFLTRGDEVAWANSNGSGELFIEAGVTQRGSIAQWNIAAGNHLIVGDFLNKGRDMVFAHRGHEVAVIDYYAPRLKLFEDELIGDGMPDSDEGWELGPSDRFLSVRLTDPVVETLVVTDGTDLAILDILNEQETFNLIVSWRAESIRDLTRGEVPILRAGRTFVDGTQSVFISSATSLTEVIGSATTPPTVRALDSNGIFPPDGMVPDGWSLSSEDWVHPMDVDGDGVQELVLKNAQRLGLARVAAPGVAPGATLVWLTEGRINCGVDCDVPMALDNRTDRLFSGQFIPGDGHELVFFNGPTWVTLRWDAVAASMVSAAVNHEFFVAEWPLLSGQVAIPGRFLALEGDPDVDLVLVQDQNSLAVVRYEADGFRPIYVNSVVGEWTLGDKDVLLAADVDLDRETEVFVRNGDQFGVLDFVPAPDSKFLARLSAATLAFEGLPSFKRGDANADAGVDISDAIAILAQLFQGTAEIFCEDAGDVDDSGDLDITDAIALLLFLFQSASPPPPPGPYTCGIDPTLDALECDFECPP